MRSSTDLRTSNHVARATGQHYGAIAPSTHSTRPACEVDLSGQSTEDFSYRSTTVSASKRKNSSCLLAVTSGHYAPFSDSHEKVAERNEQPRSEPPQRVVCKKSATEKRERPTEQKTTQQRQVLWRCSTATPTHRIPPPRCTRTRLRRAAAPVACALPASPARRRLPDQLCNRRARLPRGAPPPPWRPWWLHARIERRRMSRRRRRHTAWHAASGGGPLAA